MKKGLSIILCLTMVLSIFTVLPFTASAKEADMAETGTSKTADEAIAWCYSKVGHAIETFDSKYMYQCVDFVAAYYQYLGVSYNTESGGGYSTAAPPSGWQKIQGAQPKKGDILVYTNSSWGHVGIYESDYSTFHQNYASQAYVVRVTNLKYNDSRIGVPYWGVVRPNFAGTAPQPSFTPKNIGDDFEARIIHKSSGNAVIVNNNSQYDTTNGYNVETGQIDTDNGNQIWRFLRQSDNSYKIVNKKFNMPLDLRGGTSEIRSNIQLFDNNDRDSQRWYIREMSGGYNIIPKCATMNAMDVQGGNTAIGANVFSFTINDGDAQLFKIENYYPTPGKSTITTFDLQNWSDGSFKLLNIAWTATSNTDRYEILFYNYSTGNCDKAIDCGSSTSATLYYSDVPKGEYWVCIKSIKDSNANWSESKYGEFVAPPTPTSGWIKSSKYVAIVGEEITFTFGGEGVTPVSNYWGTIKRDGNVVVDENWNYYTGTGRTLTFDTPGTYTAFVNVNHNSGSVNSPEITFIVYKPYKIIYDANGGTNAPASEYAAYDQDFILSNDIPSNNGHKFIAWSPYPTFLYDIDFEFSPGARLRYGELGALANNNKEVILYALWGTPVEHNILGDADGDGNVTIFDATTIQRHLVSLPTQSFVEDASDCDGDGSITVLDATAIQRHLADLPTQAKGIGEPI